MLNENMHLQEKLMRRLGREHADLELSLVDPAHPRRQDAEAFVRDVFFKAYRERLDTFYPLLVSINYPDGGYAAVAGVRPAGAEALFSEHYLNDPIEKILNVDRNKIVEIGNLAPASAGQARWLICTLTKLAVASAEQLPGHCAEEWGTYYESKPAVYSGDIRVGHRAFSNIDKTTPNLVELSRLAIDAGQEFAGARSITRHG
jgi:hypothetical protein